MTSNELKAFKAQATASIFAGYIACGSQSNVIEIITTSEKVADRIFQDIHPDDDHTELKKSWPKNILQIGLSNRAENVVRRALSANDIRSNDFAVFVENITISDLQRIPNAGKVTINEIISTLADYKATLKR